MAEDVQGEAVATLVINRLPHPPFRAVPEWTSDYHKSKLPGGVAPGIVND